MMDDAHLLHESKTDDALLREVAAGDETALRTLYDRHVRWLALRLRRRLSVEATEDVLQETFFAVWNAAGRYTGRGDVAAWIWGIARRQAALWARTHGRDDLAPVFIEEVSAAIDDPARAAITRADVQHAFAGLGGEGRHMARRAFVEDRPIAEIARELDIPQGTVKSRLFHLRRKLAATLGKEHAP
jgi:RNA polymerase sigma-70 factor (ECF subfamily)